MSIHFKIGLAGINLAEENADYEAFVEYIPNFFEVYGESENEVREKLKYNIDLFFDAMFKRGIFQQGNSIVLNANEPKKAEILEDFSNIFK